MNLPFTNIRQVLSLHNQVSPEKIFLMAISDKGREELSYAEFSARCHQTANFLQEDLNIEPGSVVAIADDQPADSAVLIMACWLIGAVVISLPAASPSDWIAHQLTLSGAKVALIRSRYLSDWQLYIQGTAPTAIQRAWNKLTLIQLGGEPQTSYQHFDTLVRSMPNSFFNDHAEPASDSPAALFPTKNDMLFTPFTQGQLLDAAHSRATRQSITGNQRLISYLPLSGTTVPETTAADAVNIWLTTLLVGGSLIIGTTFNPQLFWREVAASRLHIACLSIKHIQLLIAYGREQQASGIPIYGEGVYQQDIQQLRHVYCPQTVEGDERVIQRFTALFPFAVVTNR